MRFTAKFVVAALLSFHSPLFLHAQAVTGYVSTLELDERVEGAEVALVDLGGVEHDIAVSGANGEFFLEARSSGTYTLRIRLLGYKPSAPQVVLQTDRVLEVRVNLAPQATELEGLTVYGQTAETPEQREFLSRRHLPWAFSYDRRQIEELRQGTLSDILTYGIPFGPPCHDLWVDGRRDTTLLGDSRGYIETTLDWVYGIEVYRTKYDIPLRYRDPIKPDRCGAVLVWTTTPPGYDSGLGSVWSGALGYGIGWERELLELGWRRGLNSTHATTFRLRFGRYSPIELLRSQSAQSGLLDPNEHPYFVSAYFGRQGPLFLFPSQTKVYSRIAIGGSVYLGQPSVSVPSADTTVFVRSASNAYVGIGVQVALGLRYPKGSVRPIIEVSTGSEWVMNAGARWAKPVFRIGVEIGGGS